VATGESHTVREFAEEACSVAGLDPKVVVSVSDNFRRSEVPSLCGDSWKAYEVLGWKPQTFFRSLVAEMMQHDLKALKCTILR